MDWKRIGKCLLYPPVAVMIILIPIATVFLVFSMVVLGTESVISIISYVLAAYTLTVWCFKIPNIISYFKSFKEKNKYIKIWRENPRLRVKITLYTSLLVNIAYGLLQLWLGFFHKTFWFYSLGAYYICLALMRYFLVGHTRKFAPGENLRTELVKYRACGCVFLLMNLALTLIVFFMLYWNRTFNHHMITAIAIAAYTFAALTMAIINVVKYRKYESPVFSASKAISLAAACVSMLTLTSTLLTTFGDGSMDPNGQKFLLGAVGFSVSGIVVAMAIYMIYQGTVKLKKLDKEENNG